MGLIKSLFSNLTERGKRSVRFYKYFLSYIFLVVVLLVIMGVIVYSNFIKILQKEVEESNLAVLGKICETVDTRVKEMERLAINISTNNTITYYSFVGDGYGFAKCVEELKKYRSSNIFISDILLYIKQREKQKIYTTNGVYDVGTLFSDIYKYENWNKEGFLKIFESDGGPSIRPQETITVNMINKESYITYLYTIPVNSVKPQGVVLFLIKDITMHDIIRDSMKEYNGYIYILDENNSPIFSASSGSIEKQPINVLNEIDIGAVEKGVTTLNVGKKQISISKVASEYNGWYYVTLMETNQFLYKVNTPRKIFIFTVLVVFGLGVVIAFVFSSNYYNSLKTIADMIKRQYKRIDKSEINNRDEIRFISQSIEVISNENSSLNRQLKNSIKRARSQFLMSLLKGECESKELQVEILNNFNIKVQDGYEVAVLIFKIDNYESFKTNKGKDIEDLVKFSIINVTEELAQAIGEGYGVDLMECGQIAVILNCMPNMASKNKVSEIVESVKSFFRKHYDITLTVGVGSIYESFHMVKKSFMEASRAVSYRVIKGRDQVIFYDDIKIDSTIKYSYPSMHEHKLQMSIKQSDQSQVETIIDDLIEDILSKAATPEMVSAIYYGVINSVIKAFESMNLEIDNCVDLGLDKFLVASFETIDDMKVALLDCCKKICSYIDAKRENRDIRLVEEIIAYIHENYSDSSICLETIADTFGVSCSYISKLFKACTGSSLMQYIDSYRLEKTKILLKSTDLGLRELLDSVGYVDKVNFIRKFKKSEGVTPMQYRSTYRIFTNTQ